MEKLLLVDKPEGFTSHDVVNVVRKHFRPRKTPSGSPGTVRVKVGHAGTLDPFATGLLILGIGKATKRLGELSGLNKTYEAVARLGATSTTYDPEGDVVEIPNSKFQIPNLEDVERVLNKFRGGYEQKAPIYSAKKIKGKKLYELARKGEAKEEDRPSKQVEITELEVLSYDWPTLRLKVTCGSGTYIRSLADDIGRELGCGAYLTELRRTSIGGYSIDNAVTLDSLPKA